MKLFIAFNACETTKRSDFSSFLASWLRDFVVS